MIIRKYLWNLKFSVRPENLPMDEILIVTKHLNHQEILDKAKELFLGTCVEARYLNYAYEEKK